MHHCLETSSFPAPAARSYTPPFTPIVTLIILIVANGRVVIPFLFFFLGVFPHYFVFTSTFTTVIFMFQLLRKIKFDICLFTLSLLSCFRLFGVGSGGCESAHVALVFIVRAPAGISPTGFINFQWFLHVCHIFFCYCSCPPSCFECCQLQTVVTLIITILPLAIFPFQPADICIFDHVPCVPNVLSIYCLSLFCFCLIIPTLGWFLSFLPCILGFCAVPPAAAP